MDINKLIQVVYYILSKYDFRLNYTKLIKILYLSDRAALSEIGESITGDEVYAMNKGPVLSNLYNLIKGEASTDDQNLWNKYFEKKGRDLFCKNREITDGLLCEYEEEVMDNTDAKYHSYTFGQMIDEVHKKEVCPEWKNPGGTSIYISKSEILKKMNYSDSDIAFINENNSIYNEEFKKLTVRI